MRRKNKLYLNEINECVNSQTPIVVVDETGI